MRMRRVLSQTAKRYGFFGKEIAEYLKKDPASVTGYLHGEQYHEEIGSLMGQLNEGTKNVNSKV